MFEQGRSIRKKLIYMKVNKNAMILMVVAMIVIQFLTEIS